MTREEAINEIKSWDFLEGKEIEAIHTLIPELKESEDERIRKWIIEKVQGYADSGIPCSDEIQMANKALAYLEKQKEQKHYWKPTETDVVLFNKAVTTNKALTPAERAQLDIIRSKFGCCCAVNCSGIVQKEQKPTQEKLSYEELVRNAEEEVNVLYPNNEEEGTEAWYRRECLKEHYMKGAVRAAMEILDIKERKEQNPMNNPKWNELTWKDINELEEIINHVHYEFRNGISAEGFGKEVLEQFRNMKEDAEVDACEQKPSMIQWKGDNLKEVIDFTGKSPMFNKWFKSFEDYEEYVHSHGNIFKLFNEDGTHYEVPVGAWIVKTPDGCNVASKAVFRQKPADWSYPYGRNETVDRLVAIAGCLEVDGDCLFNGYSGTECGKFLRDLARKQVECKPAECIKTEELAEHIKAEFESFRNLLKKKGIDYQPAEAYWTDFARLFVSSVKKLQKPAEWSEEDETKLRDVVRLVEDSGHVKSIREHYEKFLTSLPERFNLCPEQEWSEEDEKIIETICKEGDLKPSEKRWLKSLRPSWKPSKEQIGLLGKVYNLIWADPATPADIQDGLGDFIEQLRTL